MTCPTKSKCETDGLPCEFDATSASGRTIHHHWVVDSLKLHAWSSAPAPKPFEMKPDVKALLSKFDTNPKLQVGDLVLTAEIHRVLAAPAHLRNEKNLYAYVVHVFPTCYACDPAGRECVHGSYREIDPKGGQNTLMVLKSK